MKNLLISLLVTGLIHISGVIIDCTTLQYITALMAFGVSCYASLIWIDFKLRERRSGRERRVKRFTTVNFDGTRI